MKKVVLHISGISDINSSNRIEKELKKNHKIQSVMMNLKKNTLVVTGKEDLSIDEIEKEIESLGYKSLGVELVCATKKPSIIPFFVFGFLLILILYFFLAKAFHLPLGNLVSLPTLKIISTILTSIFLIYGIDIIGRGIKDFMKGTSSINTLVTMSIIASMSYGLHELFQLTNHTKNINHMYLIVGMFLIYMFKIGSYIDKKNKRRVESEISQLSKTKLDKVNRKVEDTYEEVNKEEVKVGDTVLCLPGDEILLDGNLTKGITHFDESLITGRSTPALKEISSLLFSGSINYEHEIEYTVNSTLKDTTTSQIKKWIVDEKSKAKPIAKGIDIFCHYWFPLLLLGYMILGILNYFTTRDIHSSLMKVILLSIISCPLGFIVIAPLSFRKNSKIAIKKKLWIKRMESLEQLRKIDTVVFDKTGTLTTGYLSITRINNHSDLEDKKLLELLGSIEKHSTTALARGITKSLRNEKISTPYDFITEDLPGYGVKAKDDVDTYYACNNELLKKIEINNLYKEEERKLKADGNTVIYLTKNGKVIATFGVKDICKKEAQKVVSNLEERKLNVILLTGDSEEVSNKIAKELGITQVVSSMNPYQKKEYIKSLLQEKHKVLMIGDGMNDAPSLAAATVGIALKNASDIPTSAADIIMDSSNLFKILDLFLISNNMNHLLKQNIFLSILIWLVEFLLVCNIIPKISMNPLFLLGMMALNLGIILLNTVRGKNK